jgi:hypothetical protein
MLRWPEAEVTQLNWVMLPSLTGWIKSTASMFWLHTIQLLTSSIVSLGEEVAMALRIHQATPVSPM